MVKRCTCCGANYWARWRNEPLELCPTCHAEAVCCPRCSFLITAPPDPAQLMLFPLEPAGRVSLVFRPTDEERYYSLRAKATQAERRRYPFQ